VRKNILLFRKDANGMTPPELHCLSTRETVAKNAVIDAAERPIFGNICLAGLLLSLYLSLQSEFWSRSYLCTIVSQRRKKIGNATSSLVRSERKNIFFCFEKRTSLLHTTLAL
jgi:hypothetical protein